MKESPNINLEDFNKLLAENDKFRTALKKISDPLLLKTNGVGLTVALRLISIMQQIAKDALQQEHKTNG